MRTADRRAADMRTADMRAADRKITDMRATAQKAANRDKAYKFLLTAFLFSFFMIGIFTLSYRSIRTSANSGFKYYTRVTVESGETLWSLSDRYMDYGHYQNKSSYIAEVKSINHLEENGVIKAGQVLIVPYYSNE